MTIPRHTEYTVWTLNKEHKLKMKFPINVTAYTLKNQIKNTRVRNLFDTSICKIKLGIKEITGYIM
jgi:hypothetical protein